MAKLTFSLDDETVRTLRRVAELKRKSQSLVIREAIVEYAAREDTLPDDERSRRLDVLRELQSQPPTRPQKDVEREIAGLRRARKTGWLRPSD
jgi:Arc/MetJ-type ribon-helix-helix transcriptional regulator